MANRVVALMKKGHRINLIGKVGRDNADVLVSRHAAHVDQRRHGAGGLDRG